MPVRSKLSRHLPSRLARPALTASFVQGVPREEAAGCADCPVCGSRGSVDRVRIDERYCLCFIPLCMVGSGQPFARCKACHSKMPAALTFRAPMLAATPRGAPLGYAQYPVDSGTATGAPARVDYVLVPDGVSGGHLDGGPAYYAPEPGEEGRIPASQH